MCNCHVGLASVLGLLLFLQTSAEEDSRKSTPMVVSKSDIDAYNESLGKHLELAHKLAATKNPNEVIFIVYDEGEFSDVGSEFKRLSVSKEDSKVLENIQRTFKLNYPLPGYETSGNRRLCCLRINANDGAINIYCNRSGFVCRESSSSSRFDVFYSKQLADLFKKYYKAATTRDIDDKIYRNMVGNSD